jgi:hypothetical protein
MKMIIYTVCIGGLIAVAGCKSHSGATGSSSSYSSGYNAGYFAAQPAQTTSITPSTASTNYTWLGYAKPGGEMQSGAGTNYTWLGYAQPIVIQPAQPAPEAQGAPPTTYYQESGQRKETESQKREGDVEQNTTIYPYSAYRGTDAHWYDNPQRISGEGSNPAPGQ